MAGLEKILAQRTWLVPEFTVWGLSGFGERDFLIVEQLGSTKTVLFGSFDIGGVGQNVSFDQLIDHRGNPLPAAITSPLVLARAKGPASPFVVGRENSAGFKIARPSDTTSPLQTDLLVVELGD